MRKGSKQKQGARGTLRRAKRSGAERARPRDAIALLKADHRQVEQWFGQFENTRSPARKSDLATKICKALKTHITIEEEIFYPAFPGRDAEEDIHHEAEVEHDGARSSSPKSRTPGPRTSTSTLALLFSQR